MRNSLAGKIKYIEEDLGGGINTWTDLTRPTDPTENVRGYNRDRKRMEFYILTENQWYYEWQGIMDLESPPSAPTLFQDDFAEGWFQYNNFANVFSNDFNAYWRGEGVFVKIMEDNFQNNWYIDNLFNNIFQEQFEDVSWD